MSLSIIISAFVTVNRKLLFYLLLFCLMNFKWNDNYFNIFFPRSSLRSFTFSSSLVRLTTTTHDSHIHKILCALSISNGMPNENRNQKLTQTNHHMNSRCLQRIELHNSWPFINKKRMERERGGGGIIYDSSFSVRIDDVFIGIDWQFAWIKYALAFSRFVWWTWTCSFHCAIVFAFILHLWQSLV